MYECDVERLDDVMHALDFTKGEQPLRYNHFLFFGDFLERRLHEVAAVLKETFIIFDIRCITRISNWDIDINIVILYFIYDI